MTRTDLEVTADVLRRTRPNPSTYSDSLSGAHAYEISMRVWNGVVEEFCLRLSLVNPRFRADKFKAACEK